MQSIIQAISDLLGLVSGSVPAKMLSVFLSVICLTIIYFGFLRLVPSLLKLSSVVHVLDVIFIFFICCFVFFSFLPESWIVIKDTVLSSATDITVNVDNQTFISSFTDLGGFQ